MRWPCALAPALRFCALLLGSGRAGNFSDVESPYEVDLPIPVFGRKCGEVSVIVGARLASYSEQVVAPYKPPSCSGWLQAVLRLDGSVRGLQFDRFGAVWLSGVEILRTTTPEPTERGITWQILRDISSVFPILSAPGNLTLQIPTLVDKTYTGILHVNVSIDFYMAGGFSGAKPATYIRGLRNWTTPSFDDISVPGNQAQINILSGLPRNMMEARLEVFASGHGCEEFWYTNFPDAYISDKECGGGSYREIEVYVDDILAGAAYPFPVVYTGGINPLLWRPVTGIASFDIPPYLFDLSPFLGLLNDGGAHNISLAVRGDRNGTWYLDGVLHAELHPTADALTGRLLHHSDDRPPLNVSERSNAATVAVTTAGSRRVSVTGVLLGLGGGGPGGAVFFSVEQQLEAWSQNSVVGSASQIVSGHMNSTSTSTSWLAGSRRPLRSAVSRSFFPYSVYDTFRQDNKTMQLGPTRVDYSRHVGVSIHVANSRPYQLQLSTGAGAGALYNRSRTNHSLFYKREGDGQQWARLEAGDCPSACMEAWVEAKQGVTTSSSGPSERCDWAASGGLYACGLQICRQPDGRARSADGYLRAVRGRVEQTSKPLGAAPAVALLYRRGGARVLERAGQAERASRAGGALFV